LLPYQGTIKLQPMSVVPAASEAKDRRSQREVDKYARKMPNRGKNVIENTQGNWKRVAKPKKSNRKNWKEGGRGANHKWG